MNAKPTNPAPLRRALRRSHGKIVVLGAFAAFWNLLAWTAVPTVMDALKAEGTPLRFVAAAFPLIGIGLAVAFGVALARHLRAPKLAVALTLPGGPGGKAVLDWRLEDPSGVRSLAFLLEGVGRTSTHKEYTALSLPVAQHGGPVPASGSESFGFPPDPGNVVRWRIAATGESGNARRPWRAEFRLPDAAAPRG